MAELRAAVIGCCGMGRGHARAAQQLGIELVAFGDVIEAAAARACEEFGGRYWTTDSERIMRDESIDLLCIATHHDAHHPLALAGARARKHMLLEKPMCLTWTQAVEVAEAVEQAGVKVVINHKFRINPAVQKIKELLPRPRLSHGQLAMADSRPGRSAWVWHPDDGGGLVVSTASHTVDLLAFLMGSRAERVYAEGRVFEQGKGEAGFPDALVGTILWQNGGLSTVISADQGLNPFVSKWCHEFWDGQRSAVLRGSRVDFGGCPIDAFDAGEVPEEERRKASMLVNLLEAIHTGGETLCTVRDGSHAVAICNALEEAARSGRPQPVRS